LRLGKLGPAVLRPYEVEVGYVVTFCLGALKGRPYM